MAGDRKRHQHERRRFLATGADWLKLAAWTALLYPAGAFLRFVIPAKPRKVTVNKVIAAGNFLVADDFILFEGSRGPWAVSRRCTHLGCRLNYREGEDLLVCPCHQSKFTVAGKRVDGPAKRDLAIYPVTRIAGKDGGSGGYIVTL